MIGIYKVKDTKDGQTFCVCASDMNNAIEAKVFIPPLYRNSVTQLKTGDKVFCVVDDASGYGAILFKFDDNITKNNTFTISNNLQATGDISADGNVSANGQFIGLGMVSPEDVASMLSAVQIVSPVGNCAVVPVSPMSIKFSGV